MGDECHGKGGPRVKGETARASFPSGLFCLFLAALASCSRAEAWLQTAAAPPDASPVAAAPALPPGLTCADAPMTVRFYDVGQALAALVELPDGRHVLVDAGDDARRSGCGEPCARASDHLVASLRSDLHGAPIDLLWITHQHSDHIGGAAAVLRSFPVGAYVDNGRDGDRPDVRRAHLAAEERRTVVRTVAPGETEPPLPPSRLARLTPIVPSAWPPSCEHDPNECTIALRIDACDSSVLFAGDAEHEEEARLDPAGPVTLLQVAHHGSETSSSPAFLFRARPRYAVISAGKPGEGVNRDYCLPRASIAKRLSRVLGGASAEDLVAFDGDRCDRATPADWVHVPTSERLWATSRDGDVVLRTKGDGVFERVRWDLER